MAVPSNPYQGNLQYDFSNERPQSFQYRSPAKWNSGAFDPNPQTMYNYDTSNSPDSDVRNARAAYLEATNPNEGTSSPEKMALYNMYKGRIMQKNALAEQINSAADILNQTQSGLRSEANDALTQGLKNTKQNFNRRGLLYSGAREAGEGAVRAGVAGQLASGITGSNRESANSVQAAENAYGAVDLAGAQQQIDIANHAFDTAKANNIARLQAMQQLGQGVGSALGTYFGGRQSSGLVQQEGGGPSSWDMNAQNTPGQYLSNRSY